MLHDVDAGALAGLSGQVPLQTPAHPAAGLTYVPRAAVFRFSLPNDFLNGEEVHAEGVQDLVEHVRVERRLWRRVAQ